MIWDVYLVGMIITAILGNKDKMVLPAMGMVSCCLWPVLLPWSIITYFVKEYKNG